MYFIERGLVRVVKGKNHIVTTLKQVACHGMSRHVTACHGMSTACKSM